MIYFIPHKNRVAPLLLQKIRSKAACIDVHFFRTKKREDKSSLAVKTIQAPIQFQHIAKRVRSRIQSRVNHVHHAST